MDSDITSSARTGQGLTGLPSADKTPVQPLYIHLVGVDHDSAERAIADLGDLGEELILTTGLEVDLDFHSMCGYSGVSLPNVL